MCAGAASRPAPPRRLAPRWRGGSPCAGVAATAEAAPGFRPFGLAMTGLRRRLLPSPAVWRTWRWHRSASPAWLGEREDRRRLDGPRAPPRTGKAEGLAGRDSSTARPRPHPAAAIGRRNRPSATGRVQPDRAPPPRGRHRGWESAAAVAAEVRFSVVIGASRRLPGRGVRRRGSRPRGGYQPTREPTLRVGPALSHQLAQPSAVELDGYVPDRAALVSGS
jgi:hypothetical protein